MGANSSVSWSRWLEDLPCAAPRSKSMWPTSRRTVDRPGPHAVFSFGSNGVAQLRSRVDNDSLSAVKAVLPDAMRCFGGYSERWSGAVATVVPMPGHVVRGSVAWLSTEELLKLDRFEATNKADPYSSEGCVYHRQDVSVLLGDEQAPIPIPATMYIKVDTTWHGPPSTAYKQACFANVSEFWDGAVVEVRNVEGEMMQDPYHGPEKIDGRKPR